MSDERHDEEVAGFLEYIRRKGAILRADGDRVHFKCPKGALAAADIEELTRLRPQLLEILTTLTTSTTGDGNAGCNPACAPVSFSQLAQWIREDLAKRPGMRSIASATRLLGALDVDALRRSIHEVARRHQALRTRIVLRDGEPVQEIDPVREDSPPIGFIVPVERDPWEVALSQINDLVLAPVDVAIGPLFASRLVKLSDEDHVLVMTMDHMICDHVSKNVLLRDVLAAYAQLTHHGAVCWPHRTAQFPDYARLQRKHHETWLRQHGAYWERRMQGCTRTRFPRSLRAPSAADVGWGTALIRIDKALETHLRHWCREHGTTAPMAVFTAYVALVLCWCNVAETVIQFETAGRSVRDAENAIGSFACSLCLRVTLQEGDDFVTLLERVTDEFCAAYEHQDFSYLAARSEPPGWTRNTVFNWMPAGTESTTTEPGAAPPAISAAPVDFPNPWLENLSWDNEPTTALFEGTEGITGSVHFARSEHSVEEMEQFVAAFLLYVRQLVSQPRRRIRAIPLPEPGRIGGPAFAGKANNE